MMEEEKKPRSLYNPTLEDIAIDFDKLGANPEHYVLKAGAVEEFPDYVAANLEEKIANKMLWANLPANKNREKRYNELLKLIRV